MTLVGQLAVEFFKISANASQQLRLDGKALVKQRGRSVLDGRVHGEIGVGDDLEALESGLHEGIRPRGDEPGELHLRQSRNFRNAAQSEGEVLLVSGESRLRMSIEAVVEKDFVHNEGEAVLAAKIVHGTALGAANIRAGGIIGIDEDDGASLLCHRLMQ